MAVKTTRVVVLGQRVAEALPGLQTVMEEKVYVVFGSVTETPGRVILVETEGERTVVRIVFTLA